jgi:hypothetical protein
MIIYEFKEGQGLGNQLWCYFSLRSIAKHLDISFFHYNLKLFKGKRLMKLSSNEYTGDLCGIKVLRETEVYDK